MVLYTEQEIAERVKSLALEISYNNNPTSQPRTMICVLNGAFMFFSDLVRNMKVDCEVDFIQVKSYTDGKQGKIRILKDISIDLAGKDVMIVDDIYDSGNTIRFIIDHIKDRNPKSITPVTLFKREFTEMTELIYGFELNNEEYLVGYGLDDINGYKRNQPFITGAIYND